MFSKKATKIDEIFTIDLTVTTYCQIDGEYFVNFVAFSENVNFMGSTDQADPSCLYFRNHSRKLVFSFRMPMAPEKCFSIAKSLTDILPVHSQFAFLYHPGNVKQQH